MNRPLSSRLRAGTLGAALVLTVTAAACSSSSKSASAPGEQLLTQTARAGTWQANGASHTLTMTDVSAVTIVFGDRPARTAHPVSTQSLVDAWASIFGNDPPNAAVQLTGGADDQTTAIVTLSKPVYDAAKSTLTYTATVIGSNGAGSLSSFSASDKDLPATFDAVSVFIDGTRAKLPTLAAKPKRCTTKGDPAGKPVKMSIVNTSSYPDDEVYVALTGKPLTPKYTTWDANPRDLINTSVPLSCLPADPSVKGGHAYSFELGEGVSAGLLWVSLGAPITSGLPDTQPSFDTTLYRFANVEFAYPGQGDMTNVDQFSFPIGLATSAAGSEKIEESSNYRADTCTIVGALKQSVEQHGGKWAQTVVKDTHQNFVRVVSPKQRARQLDKNGETPNPYAQGWPSLRPYVQTMANKTVTVQGLFTPGTDSAYYGETGWYSYTAKFDKDANVTMTGTIGAPIADGPNAKSARKGSDVTIAAVGHDTVTGGKIVGNDDLVTGLYDQSSRYSVAGVPRNGMTNGTVELAAPDDVYNSVYRDFVTAFTYGYWGGNYGADNKNFWQRFEPPSAPTGGKPSFAFARPKDDPKDLLPYNIFSQTMFEYSDNYNIPYGEDYGSGAPNRPSPLLDVPVGGTWRMTIGADGEKGCLGKF